MKNLLLALMFTLCLSASAAMAQTLRADGTMHRLWYDLRNQSLFEESFRADVLEIDRRREEMIWHVISRYAEFAGITVAASPSAVYAILDGLFQQALLHQLAGRDTAAADLQANVTQVLENLLPGTVIPALLKRHRLLSGTVDLAQPMVALAGIQTISGRVEALNTRGCIRGPSRSAG